MRDKKNKPYFKTTRTQNVKKNKLFIHTTVTLIATVNDNSAKLSILNRCFHMLLTRKHYCYAFHSVQKWTSSLTFLLSPYEITSTMLESCKNKKSHSKKKFCLARPMRFIQNILHLKALNLGLSPPNETNQPKCVWESVGHLLSKKAW